MTDAPTKAVGRARSWRAPVARAIAATLACLCLVAPGADVHAQSLNETAVRAAFVFNFGKFVEWPAGTVDGRERFTICYAGAVDALFRELGKLEDRRVQKLPIEVMRVPRPTEIRQCAVLVLAEGEARQVKREVLRAAEQAHVLTVGDAEGFAASGGAIGLVTIADRVSFEVNLDAARAAGLRIPAQLAQLGKVVGGAAR